MNITENTCPAVQFRFARPTNKLDEIIAFYSDGLKLKILNQFADHAGYKGVMIGLPDAQYHLEFTQDNKGSKGSAPTKDNLLVMYFQTEKDFNEIIDSLAAIGQQPVEPENPYWKAKSLTYEDPDGWRIVLYNGLFTAGQLD